MHKMRNSVAKTMNKSRMSRFQKYYTVAKKAKQWITPSVLDLLFPLSYSLQSPTLPTSLLLLAKQSHSSLRSNKLQKYEKIKR